jgi:hypothetical protein
MKAMLYMANREEPVAIFDEVTLVEMNDNHKESPTRILYKSSKLNASKVMIELWRDNKLQLKLEDGRSGGVVLQHNSMDMQGNAVGVLRVVDGF